MIQGSGEQWGRYNLPRMPSKIHWLVVEPPLWKIWKSVGIILPNWIGKEHVPNHQPGPWLRLKKCWKQSWIRYFDPSPTAPKGVNSTNPAATSTDYHRACSNAYSTMFPYFCHPSIAFSAKKTIFLQKPHFPHFPVATKTGWWYTYPSEKYDFVSWDDDIPNIWKHKNHVPNHQPVNHTPPPFTVAQKKNPR